MTGTRSEWLRPISERYLEGDAGPAPVAVKVAAVLSGLNAIAAAGLATVYVPMTFELVRDKPDGWGTSVAIAATVAVVAVGLFFAFAIGVSAIPRRGWRRIPLISSLILGGLAALSLLIVSLASVEANSPATDSGDVTFIAVRAGAAMACSLALIVLISRRPASDWLAKRRHAALPPSIEE